MPKIFIINSRGQKEAFSRRKVYESAIRVGASKSLAKQIASIVEKEAYGNISTSEIFKKVQKYLYQNFPLAGIRFNLKEAMRRLGPTGFPFEKYIRGILKQLGFAVFINQHLSGRCVMHEIDFVAKIYKQLLIGECKFHSAAGSRVDLETAMYNYARFLDLKTGNLFKKPGFRNFKPRPMLITNTKFTSEAIRYAECMKIDLLGWRYPEERGLEYVIESNKFYPITILPSLNNELFDIFGKEQIMMIFDLLSADINDVARRARVSEPILRKLQKEAEILIKG